MAKITREKMLLPYLWHEFCWDRAGNDEELKFRNVDPKDKLGTSQKLPENCQKMAVTLIRRLV
jgi:hypothetical protein